MYKGNSVLCNTATKICALKKIIWFNNGFCLRMNFPLRAPYLSEVSSVFTMKYYNKHNEQASFDPEQKQERTWCCLVARSRSCRKGHPGLWRDWSETYSSPLCCHNSSSPEYAQSARTTQMSRNSYKAQHPIVSVAQRTLHFTPWQTCSIGLLTPAITSTKVQNLFLVMCPRLLLKKCYTIKD